MTLKPRGNVLPAEVGSQHVRAAVERYQAIPSYQKVEFAFSMPSISGGSY